MQNLSPSRVRARQTRRGALEHRLLFSCGVLLVAGVLLVSSMASNISAMEEQRKQEARISEFAELFAEIYARVQVDYVDEVTPQQLFQGAIDGMFLTLDPHSGYLPPELQADLTRDTEGEYSGVGLHITMRDRILTVVTPMPGSPAAEVGVQPWDRILEINGESTENITLSEAVKKLTGPTGTTVDIVVYRQATSERLEFTIRRDKIKVESVYSQVIQEKLGYLRVKQFQEDTADQVRAALKGFNEQGVEGVIVDVRFNAGGLLDRAVEVCDMFLERDALIVQTKGRNTKNNREYRAVEPQLCAQPLIVLVNEGSASASEIFAGAIKDSGRGLVLGPKGKTTFGKGSVQTISALRHSLDRDENGNLLPSGLRLTTAKFYTPSGNVIHDHGVAPDIEVEITMDHVVELRQHGMLGDPSMIEPAIDDAPSTGSRDRGRDSPYPGGAGEPQGSSESEPDATAPDDEDTSGGERVIETDEMRIELKDEDGPKKFVDIQLNEAVKYLKAVLILSDKGRHAATEWGPIGGDQAAGESAANGPS